MDVRSRRARQTSPDRAKLSMQQHRHRQPPKPNPTRKVQVVYYLTRNGHLEHPHYMEVSHFATQPLRLKDVMDRLIALRGKGMPSLYSWSCKRSYKNGYVWNDLAENDVIFPADGAEYVLKGSEILEEKLQGLNVSSRQLIEEPKETFKTTAYEDQDYEDEFEEDEEKTSYTSSTTSQSRCSRGVSTDELDEPEPQKPQLTESTPKLLARSPPSLSSILSQEKPTNKTTTNTSRRFEDGDPVATESASSRNSVLLQLISCGNLPIPKAKSNNSNVVRRSSSDLHRGVLCKRAMKIAEEEDKDMISFMSENPRFGNLQAEEKEYFSGSIVESVSKDRVETQPVLKKSNSYNEERSSKAALMEEMNAVEDEEEKRSNYGLKGKCIPRKKSSSSSSKKIIRK
ncbi:protein SOSEKI 2-like isoform X2 [Mangifera indica]|uniref:protein SOSEKI 2-like isoform X2 n=1 Tax=Mangifera indica TaxID=29780 RepID=UPI001CFB2A87|nr:protein SOSEKI 2-like isoform X2 [Mangifera indica]XP_044470614.1 protein SOSEKI 2-like isoform X2 [Mangifera indica]